MAWKKAIVNTVIGGAAGAADQFVQNWDDKRATDYATANPGKTMSMWSQMGTYLNFALPLVGVLAVGMDWVKGDENATRITLVSGQLAGRKVTHRFTKGPTSQFPSPAPYSAWRRAQAEASARAAAAGSGAAGRTYDPTLSPMNLI